MSYQVVRLAGSWDLHEPLKYAKQWSSGLFFGVLILSLLGGMGSNCLDLGLESDL